MKNMFFQTPIAVEIFSLALVNNRPQYIHLEDWVSLVEINTYKTSHAHVKYGSFLVTVYEQILLIYALLFKNST